MQSTGIAQALLNIVNNLMQTVDNVNKVSTPALILLGTVAIKVVSAIIKQFTVGITSIQGLWTAFRTRIAKPVNIDFDASTADIDTKLNQIKERAMQGFKIRLYVDESDMATVQAKLEGVKNVTVSSKDNIPEDKGTINNKSFSIGTTVANLGLSIGVLVGSFRALTRSTNSLVESQGAMGGQAFGTAATGIAAMLIPTLLASHPVIAGIAGALAGVLATVAPDMGANVANAIDKATHGDYAEKEINKLADAAEKAGEALSEVRDNTEQTDLKEEYVSLANNVNRTEEEFNRLKEIAGQLGINIGSTESSIKNSALAIEEEINARKRNIAFLEYESNLSNSRKERAEQIRDFQNSDEYNDFVNNNSSHTKLFLTRLLTNSTFYDNLNNISDVNDLKKLVTEIVGTENTPFKSYDELFSLLQNNNLLNYNETSARNSLIGDTLASYSNEYFTTYSKAFANLFEKQFIGENITEKELNDKIQEYENYLNSLTDVQKVALESASKQIGLRNEESIVSYLTEAGFNEVKAEEIVNSFASEYGAQYNELRQKLLQKIKSSNINPDTQAALASSMLGFGDNMQDGFVRVFEEVSNSLSSNTEQWSQFLEDTTKLSPTSFSSWVNYLQKIEKLNLSDINNDLISLVDEIETLEGGDFNSIKEVTNTDIEGIDNRIQLLKDNLENGIDFSDYADLLNWAKQQDNFDELLKYFENVQYTSEGMKFNQEDLITILDQQNNSLKEQLAIKIKLVYYDLALAQAEGDTERIIENQAKLQLLYKDYMAISLDISTQTTDDLRERLKTWKELLSEVDRYYNINKAIANLQNNTSILKTKLNIATDSNEFKNINNDILKNIFNEETLQKSLSSQIKNDLSGLRAFLSNQFGEYLYFENDDLLLNYNAIEGLIARIGQEADENARNTLNDFYDSLMEGVNLWDELSESEQKAYEEALSLQEERKKLYEEQLQLVGDITEKIAEMISTREQNEIDEIKKKYEAIKEQDNNYLTALRNNIQKQRDIRNQENDDQDITDLQNRIAILSRDTSGFYASEIKSLRKELESKLETRADNQIDNLLSELENEQEIAGKKYDLEVEFLENRKEVRDKDNQYYIEEAKKMWAQYIEVGDTGYQALIDLFHETDEEWIKSSKENREIFDKEWIQTIAKARGAQETLTESISYTGETAAITVSDMCGQLDGYLAKINEVNNTSISPDYTGVTSAIEELQRLQQELEETSEQSIITKFLNSMSDELDNNPINLSEDFNRYWDYISARQDGLNEGNKTLWEDIQERSNSPTRKAELLLERVKELAKSLKSSTYTSNETNSSNEDKNGHLEAVLTNQKVNIQSWSNEPLEEKMIDGITYYKTGEFLPNELGYSEAVWVTQKQWEKYKQFGSYPGLGYFLKKYAQGGLVDYTGMAWVDGSKSSPEAFLSSADTKMFSSLRDVLTYYIPALKKTNISESTYNSGDTYYDVHFEIENVNDDYDVEQMWDKFQRLIVSNTEKKTIKRLAR